MKPIFLFFFFCFLPEHYFVTFFFPLFPTQYRSRSSPLFHVLAHTLSTHATLHIILTKWKQSNPKKKRIQHIFLSFLTPFTFSSAAISLPYPPTATRRPPQVRSPHRSLSKCPTPGEAITLPGNQKCNPVPYARIELATLACLKHSYNYKHYALTN